jgi:DNA-binding PucR family transcriptional regulator
MALTVANVLEDPLFGKCRLLTSAEQARSSVIRWVSVIEVPVQQFVRRNELVLTTAMNVGHDSGLLSAFARQIARSNAAALAVAIGPYIRKVPESVVRLAGDQNLALIEIRPWKLRFSEVSERVLRWLLEDQFRRKERDNYVWALATGRLAPDLAAARNAKRLGAGLEGPFCAVAARVRLDGDERLSQLDAILDEMAQIAEAHAAAWKLSWLGTTIHGSIVAFVSSPDTTRLDQLLKQWLGELTKRFPRLRVIVGVSERYGTPLRPVSSTCYREAADAALEVVELGMRGANDGVVRFRTVATQVLIQRAAADGLGQQLLAEFLGDLVEHDHSRKMKLIPTLESYLQHGGNISACARALGIRRQSLMYRLETISRMSRCKLDDADSRLSLQIALRLLRSKMASRDARAAPRAVDARPARP